MSLHVQRAARKIVQCNRETTYGPGCRFLMVLMFSFPAPMSPRLVSRSFFRYLCFQHVQLVPMSGSLGLYIRDLWLARGT